MYCQFMLSSFLTNYADIKDNSGRTAADAARGWGHSALADYVEGCQPGPRGELPSAVCTQCSQYKVYLVTSKLF